MNPAVDGCSLKLFHKTFDLFVYSSSNIVQLDRVSKGEKAEILSSCGDSWGEFTIKNTTLTNQHHHILLVTTHQIWPGSWDHQIHVSQWTSVWPWLGSNWFPNMDTSLPCSKTQSEIRSEVKQKCILLWEKPSVQSFWSFNITTTTTFDCSTFLGLHCFFWQTTKESHHWKTLCHLALVHGPHCLVEYDYGQRASTIATKVPQYRNITDKPLNHSIW